MSWVPLLHITNILIKKNKTKNTDALSTHHRAILICTTHCFSWERKNILKGISALIIKTAHSFLYITSCKSQVLYIAMVSLLMLSNKRLFEDCCNIHIFFHDLQLFVWENVSTMLKMTTRKLSQKHKIWDNSGLDPQWWIDQLSNLIKNNRQQQSLNKS